MSNAFIVLSRHGVYAVYLYRNQQLSSERNLMEFVSGKLKFSTVKILCRKATDECVISVADRKLAENHRVTSKLWSKICMVPHVFILLDASF